MRTAYGALFEAGVPGSMQDRCLPSAQIRTGAGHPAHVRSALCTLWSRSENTLDGRVAAPL